MDREAEAGEGGGRQGGGRRPGDSDVFVAASRDGGKTWGPPARVNDDPVKNGRDQLFAWMAVDPADVDVLRFDQAQVAVSQGIVTGDIVVTAGVQALHPGQKIRILGSGPS